MSFAGHIEVTSGAANVLNVGATHAFAEPGTYFPALRVTTQRQGDTLTRHARIHNLGRVRVVVRSAAERR